MGRTPLKINMEPFSAGWLSILPPIIAIAIALPTKEVFSSLLIGVISGAAIYCFGSGAEEPVLKTLDVTFTLMAEKVDFEIILFCSLLGSLVYLLNMSGGTRVYGEIARKKIKSRKTSLLSTCWLGLVIFIDDYLNCLTVGTVMHPITDSYRVSRAKLAYIIDSTAAPVCVIAPISSWAAAIGSSLKTTGAFESDFAAFLATIPYNFYAIFCILLVIYISYTSRDFGPMRTAEEKAILTGNLGTAAGNGKDQVPHNPKGTIWDMVIPLAALIVFSGLALLYHGGYWGKDPAFHTISAALGNSSATKALVWSSFGALAVAFIMYIPRKVLSFADFMSGSIEGMKLMLPANIILILAWALSGVCRDLLMIQGFVEGCIAGSTGLDLFLPAVLFVIAGLLSFATGASWGTFGILIPIAVPVAQAIDPNLLIVSLSATLAGAVFGDHCSPISDTTILSSAGAGCRHVDHVTTQMPYAWFIATCCVFGYLAAGFTHGSWIASFGVTALVFVAFLAFMYPRSMNAKALETLASKA